ncbi:hypothetical protein C8R45DRAFT_1171454 [Mycena sanguinolenta]|nr:hypothetical protein C8R45DRAFT_1171454 [Mycena sanguinolenta]
MLADICIHVYLTRTRQSRVQSCPALSDPHPHVSTCGTISTTVLSNQFQTRAVEVWASAAPAASTPNFWTILVCCLRRRRLRGILWGLFPIPTSAVRTGVCGGVTNGSTGPMNAGWVAPPFISPFSPTPKKSAPGGLQGRKKVGSRMVGSVRDETRPKLEVAGRDVGCPTRPVNSREPERWLRDFRVASFLTTLRKSAGKKSARRLVESLGENATGCGSNDRTRVIGV